MRSYLLLAQSAEEGVGLLQTIIQGGAALILAVVAVALGYACYRLLMRSHTQENERLVDEKATANQRLLDQEKLLREQIDRERGAQETVTAAVQAIEGFSHTIDSQKVACEATGRAVAALGVKIDGVMVKLRDLEDTIRRVHRDA